MTNRALYVGSFDPLTKGHMTLIAQAAKLYDELIIAIAVNTTKKVFLPLMIDCKCYIWFMQKWIILK